MIIKLVSAVFFASSCNGQWAFLGGSTDENNSGKYSGKNLWPSARFFPGSEFDGKELFLFGGGIVRPWLCDLWVLDIETLQWKLLGPSHDPLNFQGSLVDQGKFSSNNWPVPLSSLSMFKKQNLLYLFPSYDGNDNYFPKFFIYNRSSNEWFFDEFQQPVEFQFQESPYSFNSFLDYNANSFYLIGAEENIYVANMTSLEFSIYSEAKYSFPLTFGCSVVNDESIYIFGGFNQSHFPLNSLFKFNFSSNELVKLNRYSVSSLIESNFGPSGTFNKEYFPSGRTESSLQLSRSRNQLIIFGGFNFITKQAFSDLWLFDLNLTSWAYFAGPTEPNVPSKYKKKGIPSIYNYPSSRIYGISFYDNKMETFYIFGGQTTTDGAFNDLWAFYFEKSTLKVSSAIAQTSTISTMKLLLKEATFIATKFSFPLWVITIIAISILLLLGFCIYTIFIKDRHGKKPTFALSSTSKQEKIVDTLFNTNIGLSDHFSLQQDSSLFAEVKSLAKGGQAEIFIVQIMDIKLVTQFGSNVAVQKVFFNSARSKEILLHEVSIMEMLKKYPCFVTIIAYTLDPLSIVMKYYSEGSLYEWIEGNQVGKKLKLRFSFEIASALKTMHSHSLAHCDIKSQNVLIDIVDGEPHCCLSDFGITQILSESIVASKAYKVFSLRGLSFIYAAPETFSGFRSIRGWDFKGSDVYSFGCLLYEIITAVTPWERV